MSHDRLSLPIYQQEQQQQPRHASSPSTQQLYDPQHPSYPSSTHNADYATPTLPSPSVSRSQSLSEKYNPVGSEPSYLSRSASNASERKKKPACCGSRYRRSLCACCLCFLFLIVAAVAAIFLLAKAPEVSFQSVEPPSNGLPPFTVDGSKFTINLNLKIGIKNPNLIGVTVSKVTGEATFPVSETVIGNGQLTDLSIPNQSNQVVLFPIQINYDPNNDPERKMLFYVANQCGSSEGTKGKLDINYSIKLTFGFLATFGIVPSFNNRASFDCPMDGLQLPGFESLSASAIRRRSLRSLAISRTDWL